MCPVPAARYTDPIEHTEAMAGFLIGLAAGAALALTAVAVVGTGGAALGVIAAVGGVLATTGGAAMIGGAIGQMFTSVSGAIAATCSTNVKINNLGAARADIDTADCEKHPGHPGKHIATGAATVIINGYPAARKDEALECGGWISGGSDNVLIGGPSVQVRDINPEIPEWMTTGAEWMVNIGSWMMMGAGALMALSSRCAMLMFVNGMANGWIMEAALEKIGGMIGYAIDGERGQAIGEMAGGFLGDFVGLRSSRAHPVDVATGELFTTETDFVLPGPLPLNFTRTWMSSSYQDGSSGELGAKWNHSLDLRLMYMDESGAMVLRHEDGHLGFFPPTGGQPVVNLIEREVLRPVQTPQGRGYVVSTYDAISYTFTPDPAQKGAFRLQQIADANGNTIQLRRDAKGHLTGIRDSSGRDLVVSTNAQGWITRIAAPAPHGDGLMSLVSFSYSPQGDMIAASDARGNAARYDYTGHLLTRETWRGGTVYHFRWDDLRAGTRARCIETWGESAEAGMRNLQYARFDYDPETRLTRVTDAAEGVVLYEHNQRNKVVRQTDPEGVVTTWSFDMSGHETAMRDDLGRGEAREYDSFARLISIKSRHGLSVRLRYASDDPLSPLFGAVVEETLGEGKDATIERREYDPRGNLLSVIDPLGQQIRVMRDARGMPVATTDAMGTRWRWQWDAQGMLAAEGPDQLQHFYLRDRLGRLVRQRDGATVPTSYEYDPNGNLIAMIDGDGRRASMEYDADNNRIMHRDPAGHVTRDIFAGLTKPIQQIAPDETQTNFRYDHEMRLLAVRNGNGDVTENRFNQMGQRVFERSFDGTTAQYRYDRFGYPAEIENADGITRTSFDAVGRLLSCVYPDGTRHEFEYDRGGQLLASTANGIRTERRFDALGRCVAETTDGHTTAFEFDCRDNVIATILPGGEVLRNSFNRDSVITAMALDASDIARFRYAPTGELLERRQAGTTRSYLWDDVGRPQAMQLTRNPTTAAEHPTLLVGRRYGWNPDNTLSAVEDSRRGLRQFRYDPAKRLIGIDGPISERMRYDRADNLTALSRSQPEFQALPGSDLAQGSLGFTATARGDRLHPTQDSRLDYDAAGNVTAITTPDSRLTLSYGDCGMLTKARRETAGLRVSAVYRYDAFARRIAKHVLEERLDASGAAVDSHESATAFLWDGDRLIAEGPADGDRLARLYFYESDGLTPLGFADRQPDGSRAFFYCNTDLTGQPLEVFDAAGEMVWAAQYTAYGVALADIGKGFHQPLRFPGQYHDPETGLHYNRHRYYMPQFGRYSQPDPIGLQGGLNAYFYPTNPTLGIDPLGLDAKEDSLGVIYANKQTSKPWKGTRRTGINRAWKLEAELVRANDEKAKRSGGTAPAVGYGTREWTPEEKKELLKRGRVSGYDADHINSVNGNRNWRGDPRNIRFLPNHNHPTLGNQHRYENNRGHSGNTRIPKFDDVLLDRRAMIDRANTIAVKGCGK